MTEESKMQGRSANLPVNLLRAAKRADGSTYNARKHFDDAAMAELVASISEKGVLQPLVVREVEGSDRYEVIAGERRLRAAKLAGLHVVPVMIREASTDRDVYAIMFAENSFREDVNPLDRALSFKQMQDDGISADEIAAMCQISRTVVTEAVRLLDLPREMQTAILEGKIGAKVAQQLVRIESPILQANAFKQAMAQEIFAADIAAVVRRSQRRDSETGRAKSTVSMPDVSGVPEMESDLRKPENLFKAVASMKRALIGMMHKKKRRLLIPIVQEQCEMSSPDDIKTVLDQNRIAYDDDNIRSVMNLKLRPKGWVFLEKLTFGELEKLQYQLPYRRWMLEMIEHPLKAKQGLEPLFWINGGENE